MNQQVIRDGVSVARPSGWKLLHPAHGYNGFAYGARFPSLTVLFQGCEISDQTKSALWEVLIRACPAMGRSSVADEKGTSGWLHDLFWLLTVWQRVQQASGLALFETGRILSSTATQARCLVPVLSGSHKGVARLIHATLEWIDSHDGPQSLEEVSKAEEGVSRAVKSLAPLAAQGSNVPRFVKAAHELGLPMMALPGGVIQFGKGSKARRLDSSFTDETPTIAAKLARNKRWTSSILEQAGLPVPAHSVVADEAQAVSAAKRLGYPVVVKPADLDGGVGVAAGLEQEADVRQAFGAAHRHSHNILVEKHVFGRDYRLVVFQGELIWAIERVPAAVIGDGRQTVDELVAQVNADPRRGTGQHAPLKSLVIDEEALSMLGKEGLSPQSVPNNGQFVRLRRTANIASGGQPVVAYDKVHPDNARLAVRAAQALGLDLAGIDLLIDDVSKSWLDEENNAAICEVNGQPNLGQTTAAHLYGEILQKLVLNGGRVPTILVLGAEQPEIWLQSFTAAFQQNALRVGSAGAQGVSFEGEPLSKGAVGSWAAGRMLALDRRVDAIVLEITDDSILKEGLPWARYDVLVLAGKNWPHPSGASTYSETALAQLWLEQLLPACDGMVVSHQAFGLKVSGIDKISTARWLDARDTEQDLAAKVAQYLTREPNVPEGKSL